MKDIPQLIGHTFGVAYLNIHIEVRVTIYPEIDPAILDVVFQLHGEGSIDLTVCKLRALHLEGWNMMGNDYLFVGLAA